MKILTFAKKLAEAAEAAAMAAQVPIVTSVVDSHGNELLRHRMDGAPLHSLEMAFRKAYTAASFGVRTESLTGQVQPGEDLYGLTPSSGNKLVAFGGGAPLDVGEIRIGVGISGGTTKEDMDILDAAIASMSGRKP